MTTAQRALLERVAVGAIVSAAIALWVIAFQVGSKKPLVHVSTTYQRAFGAWDVTVTDPDGRDRPRLSIGHWGGADLEANARLAAATAQLFATAMRLDGGIEQAQALLRAELARQQEAQP